MSEVPLFAAGLCLCGRDAADGRAGVRGHGRHAGHRYLTPPETRTTENRDPKPETRNPKSETRNVPRNVPRSPGTLPGTQKPRNVPWNVPRNPGTCPDSQKRSWEHSQELKPETRNLKPGNIWLDELVCSGSETNIANAAPATLKLPTSQFCNRCRGTNLKCAGTNGF